MSFRASLCSGRGAGIFVAALTLLPLSVFSADSNRPTTPVSVEGTVDVQGMVEVLNDVLRQPYVVTVSSNSSSAPSVDFDIPDGKRLIVETIAFQASTSTGSVSRMFLHPLVNGSQPFVPLPIQTTSVEGPSTYLISMLPMKMRVDSAPGSTREIFIRRGTGDVGTLTATICGYLVDL